MKEIDWNNPEECLAAVKQNGWDLQFVKEQTPEICLVAVKQQDYAFKYINKELKEKIFNYLDSEG